MPVGLRVYQSQSRVSSPSHTSPGRKSAYAHPISKNENTWDTLPACRTAAESLTVSKRFECLDAGRLLKHMLELTRTFGQGRFVLLYLWYEVEGSEASDKHRDEVVEFSRLISTEVQFRSETYQRFFDKLTPSVVGTSYKSYLRSRYFENL